MEGSMNMKRVSLVVAIGFVVGASAARLSAQEMPLEESLAEEQLAGEEDQTAQAQTSPPAAMGEERGPMTYGHMRMEMMRLSPRERCLDHVAHLAGLVAYLEVRLDLTPEQRPLWGKLKDAAQAGIEKQRQVCESVGAEDHPPTVLDREARAEQFLAAQLALLQSTRPALEALYTALSPEQRAVLDRPWRHRRF
jgi:hypothetical protein